MTSIAAVLLDVDGTLIDSNDAHANAWVDAAREFGFTTDFDRVRCMIGMGGDRVLPDLTGLQEDSERGKALLARRSEILRNRYLPTLQPFADARALVERLARDQYRLVVASSSNVEDLGKLLEQAGVSDLLHARTSSDDAESSKPSPDIVDAALRDADCAASAAVMIGDTPYDVEAAQRAGVRCIAFRCGGWSDAELSGAHAIYDGPWDLLESYDSSILSSPAGRSS
jgi:phosphoglycolate phosphatase-like HAD superfamily hydrolase